MPKVLLIDDDEALLASLRQWLINENMEVECADCGLDGLQLMNCFDYDIVVLDWNMPDIDGIEVLKRFRASGKNTPVIFLTGNSDLPHKMAGLTSGADDFITKPFHAEELLARVRAILRRPRGLLPTTLTIGNVTLTDGSRTVLVNDVPVALGRREYSLLEFLMHHPNETFRAKDLIRSIWPSDSEVTDEAVRVCVNALRKKIGTDKGSCILKTVLGSGYTVEIGKE